MAKDPTPAQIRRQIAKIQKGWTPQVRAKRTSTAYLPKKWTIQGVYRSEMKEVLKDDQTTR